MADPKFRAFLASMAKKWGDGALIPLTAAYPKLARASWGNLQLDLASGGGFARGRAHRILGPESSGKSQTPLRAYAANQRRCNVCWKMHPYAEAMPSLPMDGHDFVPFRVAWVDAEGSTATDWVERHGIALPPEDAPLEDQHFHISRPGYAQEAVDILVQLVRGRHFAMVVFDSIGGLASTDELEKSAEDRAKISDTALLMNRAMRILTAELASREDPERGKPAVFLINHVYAAIDPYGPKDFTRGGRGQNYLSSFDLYLERRNYMLRDGTVKIPVAYAGGASDEDVVKAGIRFMVRKSKISTPGRAGEYWSYVSETADGRRPGDVDCGASLLDLAERYGVIKSMGKVAGYVRVATGEALETSHERLAEVLNTNDALQREITDDLMRAIDTQGGTNGAPGQVDGSTAAQAGAAPDEPASAACAQAG